MSSHQAIMKCPWQWRQPFLDEKRASRKRKVGDGYFYDPVDPSFVDHLLPGHAKKFCANVLETDEKEKIELEIQRLMLEKEERAARLIYDALVFGNATANSERASRSINNTSSSRSVEDSASVSNDTDAIAVDSSASVENMALVDSILLMTKSVDESSLLASPKSVSSPLSPLLDDSDDEQCLSLNNNSSSRTTTTTTTTTSTCLDTESDADFDEPLYARASSLELVSDNLQDNYFASEDSDLLDFPAAE